MAKPKGAKRNREIAEQYEIYEEHLNSNKTIHRKLTVDKEKKNQINFYEGSVEVSADVPWGNTSTQLKIRKDNEHHYTIAYLTDALKNGLLCRLDAGAGTHRNLAPDIPLALTSVPTPHLHRFRNDGYDIAYPIPNVDYSDESSTKFDYVDGFFYFCDELRISGPEGTDASVLYTPPGTLPLQIEDIDPNANIDFPE